MPSTTSTTGAVPSPRRANNIHALASRWFPLRGWTRSTVLFLYYLAILIGLMVIYSRGNFTTPTFIYQGF